MNALELKNVSKSFPGFKLDDLSITLPTGCIMGLVGENGAGKSTTIKLILNILRKESGTITILGRDNQDDIRLTKEEVGVVFDEVGIPECMTAIETGKVMSRIYSSWDSSEYTRLLDRMTLPVNRPFKDLSRGMKMKLGIAVAMSHHSRLLLLDEPTSGLDPVVRDEVVDMFADFTRDEDHSILISSHIVSDLEKLCDYIAFLHKGRLMLCEEKDELLAKYGLLHCTSEQLKNVPKELVVHKRETAYGIEALIKRNGTVAGMSLSPVSIEELFVFMAKEAK